MTSRRSKLPSKFVLTDANSGIDPFVQTARLTGSDALILRHYEWEGPERLALARELRCATRTRKASLLIAGDANLALCVRADGIHLPAWQIRGLDNRAKKLKPDWLITAAAHDEVELRAAAKAGANATLLSPVFPTRSHPDSGGLGIVRFAALSLQSTLPVFAMGGITETSFKRLRDVPNVQGQAAVTAF